MFIIKEQIPKTWKFKDVGVGQCFCVDNHFYIKIGDREGMGRGVDLSCGALDPFEHDSPVILYADARVVPGEPK